MPSTHLAALTFAVLFVLPALPRDLNLGWICREGAGAEADPKRAFDYDKRAAALGVNSAMFNLGVEYAEGDIVSRNLEQAQRWFARAAAGGHKKARHRFRRLQARSSR